MAEELVLEKKALDTSGEMPIVEGTEDEEFLLARDLTKSFVKTIKAFRFYPSDNPMLKVFREQLPRKFSFFLGRYSNFILQIDEHTLSYKGKVLYENKDVKASLAFLFYKDGLREIRLMRGLEDWEIQGLVDIIVRWDNINQLEEDLVTLFWEKDFVHIGYLATDEFLKDMPVIIPENAEELKKDLVARPLGHEVELDFWNEEEEGIDVDETLSKLISELHSSLSNRSVYSLTAEETERLRKEVESETAPTFVFNIVDILFEILVLERDPEPYKDAVNVLGKVLDAMLTLGEFQMASELLKRVHTIPKTHKLQDWQTESLRRFITEAGESQRIDRIGRIIEQEEGVKAEDAYNYLILLEPNTIKPLIRLLGERTKSRTRRVICDALSELGRNAPELFTPYLDDPRWYLVRNIIYVLGRIGKEESFPDVQKALFHQDPRVRREAIQASGLVGGPKALGALVKALGDPDARVRAMAAIGLGKMGRKSAVEPLMEVVQSKEFQRRDAEEIKAFFDAIGMVGGSKESIVVLKQLLFERKGWFGRGVPDEIRIGAAQALAAIGTPEAKGILASGKDSKEESIRQACYQALKSKSSRE